MRAEEAGALHRLGPHERRRDDGREAGLDRRGHRQVDQRQLEQRAPAGEEGEAAAADLRAALGVDRAERRADVEVVLDREVVRRHLADLLQDDEVLLAAGRDAVEHDVGHGEVRGAQRGLGLGLRGLGRLDLGGERLGPLEDRRALLRRGRLDRLRRGLLLRPQAVGAGHGGAAGLVGGEQRVDQRGVVAAGALRGADAVGVGAQDAEVDHPLERTGEAVRQSPGRREPLLGEVEPGPRAALPAGRLHPVRAGRERDDDAGGARAQVGRVDLPVEGGQPAPRERQRRGGVRRLGLRQHAGVRRAGRRGRRRAAPVRRCRRRAAR